MRAPTKDRWRLKFGLRPVPRRKRHGRPAFREQRSKLPVNWINNVVRPKIRSLWSAKRDVPENLWVKCPETGKERFVQLFDGGDYEAIPTPSVTQDPLKFRDEKRYVDRLRDSRAKTGNDDAILVGAGRVEGNAVVAAVQDFDFMGGSLGMAAGEAIIRGVEEAVARSAAFVMFTASGGARMQEGILSLMQMPRTTVAVEMLREAGLPYIVVLTNPTLGGVTASYAMLGDVHIAEPGALIGFAGPRVIEQTIREKLPEGFQRSEYLHEHGMVDLVVHRHQMRATIGRLVRLLTHAKGTALISA
ncbi:MAG: accD [Proteobacteria bacterium]|nr:accD [Pseudomonadota bacterium]